MPVLTPTPTRLHLRDAISALYDRAMVLDRRGQHRDAEAMTLAAAYLVGLAMEQGDNNP